MTLEELTIPLTPPEEDRAKVHIMVRIKDIIADELKINRKEIKDDSDLRDLGADSLASIDLMCAVEDEFEVDFDDYAPKRLTSVKLLTDYVYSLKHNAYQPNTDF